MKKIYFIVLFLLSLFFQWRDGGVSVETHTPKALAWGVETDENGNVKCPYCNSYSCTCGYMNGGIIACRHCGAQLSSEGASCSACCGNTCGCCNVCGYDHCWDGIPGYGGGGTGTGNTGTGNTGTGGTGGGSGGGTGGGSGGDFSIRCPRCHQLPCTCGFMFPDGDIVICRYCYTKLSWSGESCVMCCKGTNCGCCKACGYQCIPITLPPWIYFPPGGNDPGGGPITGGGGDDDSKDREISRKIQEKICDVYRGFLDFYSLNSSTGNYTSPQEQFIISLANLAALYELGASLETLRKDLVTYAPNSALYTKLNKLNNHQRYTAGWEPARNSETGMLDALISRELGNSGFQLKFYSNKGGEINALGLVKTHWFGHPLEAALEYLEDFVARNSKLPDDFLIDMHLQNSLNFMDYYCDR